MEKNNQAELIFQTQHPETIRHIPPHHIMTGDGEKQIMNEIEFQ